MHSKAVAPMLVFSTGTAGNASQWCGYGIVARNCYVEQVDVLGRSLSATCAGGPGNVQKSLPLVGFLAASHRRPVAPIPV